MADIKLVGAVAIKVRPDARGFRGDTQRQVTKELAGLDATVTVKVKGDTTELATDVERAKRTAERKGMTLKVDLDYDSVRRAQQQLDRAIRSMSAAEIEVKLDDEGIAKAQAELDALKHKAKVEMTYVQDEKGYKAVLAKIAEIRRQKLEKEVSFDTDDASLNRMERKFNKRLAKSFSKATVSVSYNNNRSSIEAAINQVNRELDRIRQVEFDVSLDAKSLKTARRMLEAALTDTPVELKVNYDDQDSLKATRTRLRQMLTEVNEKTLKVAFNEEALRAELHRIDQMIKDEVEDKDRDVELPVHTTGLELVARQLQFASRARRVPFHVVVDRKSLAVAEGLLRSLAGINTLQSAGRGLESIITKFDTFLLKGAAWGTAIFGLADTLLYLTSAVFTVGGGMAQVVGLLAAAPLAFAALASVLTIGIAVFKDFGAAAHGIDAALKRLPPSGQKAALMIRKVFAEMRESISEKFWGRASDAMLRFVETALPAFTRGLVATSDSLGEIFGRILDSFTNLTLAGDLDRMFANLTQGFRNAEEGTTAFWNALNELGLKGSEMFPRFGTWLTDMSVRFERWIDTASRNGDITSWIEGGINSLKDMWHATGAIIDQFKALTRAANLVGPNGLDDFRRNMRYVADLMLAEPFQSKMGTIFFGARRGATELNKGVKDLVGSFADAANWTSTLLTMFGRLGGEALTGLSRTISNLNFQSGMLDALRGMSDMVKTMNPAFDKLGSLLGNVGRIAASVFRGLGPVFNTLLGILDDTVGKLQGNLSKLAPSLLTLTNNLLSVARGPINLVVDVLNAFLGVLNALPAPLRDGTLAFVAFLLLRNQFGAFATSLSRMWTNITTSSVAGAASTRAATAAVASSVSGVDRRLILMADGSVRQMTRFGIAMQTGMATARAHIASFQPASIVSRMSAAAAGVGAAVGRVNSSLALIGGVPGLLLGVIGVTMATLGGNAAEASASIDRLRESLDKASGAATPETLTAISTKVSEIDKAGDAWANFWRGVMKNSKAGNETLDQLGISIAQVSRIIAGSRADYDSFVTSLKTLGSAGNLKELAEFMKTGGIAGDVSKRPMAPGDEFATNVAKLKQLEEQAKAVKALGLNPSLFEGPNAINTQSIQNLTTKMDEQRLAFELAQRGQAIYAQTLGTTVERSKEVASIVATIGDVSADAAGKIDAINRSLAILNGSGLSEQDAKIKRMDGLEAAVENAKAIAESVAASRQVLFDSNGIISEQSKAGRDLYKILRQSADDVKIQAQAAYDTAIKNGDTAAVAAEKAVSIVRSGDRDLQKIADAAGLTVAELRGQWSKFFGSEWDLKATFSANLDNFLAGQAEAKALGVEFNESEFTAWLLANPDPANVTTEQVKEHMREYAATTFKAKLDALPAPAQAMIADVVGRADAFARGDYRAVLAGLNATEPAVQSAIASIMRMTGPNWQARLSALLDAGSLATVESQLNFAARNRTAFIKADASQVTSALDYIKVKGGMYANGGILNKVAAFANGGITGMVNRFASGSEKHVASIYRPSSMLRVFAEPETGGEAYIPLAVSKRPRSVSILGEVAKKFGYELTRSQNYANGAAGGHTVPTRTNNTSVTVGTINTVDPESAVRKLQAMQRDALAVAGIDS